MLKNGFSIEKEVHIWAVRFWKRITGLKKSRLFCNVYIHCRWYAQVCKYVKNPKMIFKLTEELRVQQDAKAVLLMVKKSLYSEIWTNVCASIAKAVTKKSCQSDCWEWIWHWSPVCHDWRAWRLLKRPPLDTFWVKSSTTNSEIRIIY